MAFPEVHSRWDTVARMRKPLIAANWKMYKTPTESVAFLHEFLPLVRTCCDLEIAIYPTMSSLASVIGAVKGTNVSAGAQTMHWLNEGPYNRPDLAHHAGQHRLRPRPCWVTPSVASTPMRPTTWSTGSSRRPWPRGLFPWSVWARPPTNATPDLPKRFLRWQISCALNSIRPPGR